MPFDHDTLVWFSKTFGLFYLIGLSVLAIAYAFWPSKKKEFDEAADCNIHRRGQTVAELERDPHTGYLTTGHEWNGIKELNSPVPIAVYVFIAVTHLFALVYWVLMPTWPL